MSPSTKERRPQTAPAVGTQDPFDLDISVLKSGEAASVFAASDDSCAATCGTSCASNVA